MIERVSAIICGFVILYAITFCRTQIDCRLSASDYPSSTDFDKMMNQMDEKLEVLQLQLHESNRSISRQLEKEAYLKYSKLESRLCNMAATKTKRVSLDKHEQLMITVNSLLESNHVSVEKFEILKTFVDCIAVNNNISMHKQQDNETVNVGDQAAIAASNQLVDDDIFMERKVLKQIIKIVAESSVSLEKFEQLRTLIDVLAESNVSRDYVDVTLKKQAMDRLDNLQKIVIAIRNIDNKNTALEERNSELQRFIGEMKKQNNDVLVTDEIKNHLLIIKAMKDENNKFKTKFDKMMTKMNDNLNKSVVQMIQKLLAEQMP